MTSNLYNSDGLQPTTVNDGLQPTSDGLQLPFHRVGFDVGF